ncbi:hypothetical protein [Pseudolactococcus chungangensis]|uniref:hypothetical protein n=1 Tax=Pseudolactococcus chungangensis TaxID=451457 RepID=UPI0028D71CBE|nr:hypothetical protein [Lactococcus chungangensis]
MKRITWEQFEAVNEDKTTSFEDMCRLLFNRQFFDNKKNLTSKPNHPGVEIYPVFEEKSEKRISFQAKFFSSKTDYDQIKKSVEKTVDYYSDHLDIFYLYCNKDLDSDSRSYKKIEELLNSAGIEIQLITNHAILDQVFSDSIIAEYFFNHHSLNDNWFREKLRQSLDSIGTRYNNEFNISTETEKEFRLFLKNSETLKIIEEKKDEAINELRNLRQQLSGSNDLLAKSIIVKIQSLEITEINNIENCLSWGNAIQEEFSREFKRLEAEIEANYEDQDKENQNKENKGRIYQANLHGLLNISSYLKFSNLETNLIKSKVLVINGRVGTGKSQLLSENANKIVNNGGHTILLPGHVFLSSEPIKNQILTYLDLEINFLELLNILETVGELTNKNTYLFIDALNESNHKEIWKIGLPILFQEIEKFNFIKIAISFRSGYEDTVIDETISKKITNYEIPEITHNGFWNNSIEAIKEFLNYHQISFSPSYFFQSEMTNPLFLTMFCKIYDGNEFDFYQLLEKFLEKADRDAQKVIGIQDFSPILNDLVTEIANFQLEKGLYAVGRNDILKMDFWNDKGLSNNKLQYLSSLGKSGIFVTFMRDGVEEYRFGYELLENFISAKVIIDRFSSSQECKKYLRNDLLKIDNKGRIEWEYVSVFIVATNLFFAKFGEECIDITTDIADENDRNRILNEYVKSFSWRPSQSIDLKSFNEFIDKNRIARSTILDVLIENSVKPNNPLNAEFLHEILINKPLNIRDYMWTIYINDLVNEDNRIFQLINFLGEGKKVESSRENTRLLLVLFSWLLTSSNRLLRDKASKAMIELLKDDFSLILSLLKKFENVNDPYVIQRLYGIVFGACTKNLNVAEPEYKELAEYIYITIFDKDLVYPDILLRDYAKLIIEYFLFKFPKSKTIINELTFRPPYNSDPIPIAKKAKDKYEGGLDIIAYSMALGGVDRMQGDFGRYVFDSALRYFSGVDSVNIYNYSMDIIENKLEYKNELFTEYDRPRNPNSYYRYSTGKIERIGKKYQWITMYNILARVSDHYEFSDRYSCTDDKELEEFNGAWNPYVRDFDPTLNINFLSNPEQPKFEFEKQKSIDFIDRDASSDDVSEWINSDIDGFFIPKSELLFLDKTGCEWVALDHYNKIDYISSDLESSDLIEPSTQKKWVMAQGYFIKKNKYQSLREDLVNKNFIGRWFPEGTQNIYWLFNREFGWASGYKSLDNYAWLDYEIESDKFEIVEYPDYESIIKGFTEKGENQLEVHNKSKYKKPISKLLAKVMKSFNRFLWEEEYDSSQNEATSFEVPCGFLIDDLKLKQLTYDGYYYDIKGELVAFYSRDSNKFDSPYKLMIRKKHLDNFLIRNGLILFWECLGEKQFINEDMRHREWSEWSGLLTLTDDGIVGEMIKYDI